MCEIVQNISRHAERLEEICTFVCAILNEWQRNISTDGFIQPACLLWELQSTGSITDCVLQDHGNSVIFKNALDK